MTFYINENEQLALELTGLALDELEGIVGRFGSQSARKGMLRGKVLVLPDSRVQIRKCFGNKLLWEAFSESNSRV
jgi:hypothetical protein